MKIALKNFSTASVKGYRREARPGGIFDSVQERKEGGVTVCNMVTFAPIVYIIRRAPELLRP